MKVSNFYSVITFHLINKQRAYNLTLLFIFTMYLVIIVWKKTLLIRLVIGYLCGILFIIFVYKSE